MEVKQRNAALRVLPQLLQFTPSNLAAVVV